MVDLTGYRCLVAVNFLSDIPGNLEITVGYYTLSVLIQLERWSRRDAATPVNPPNERTDQHDPLRSDPAPNYRSAGSVRGRRSSAGSSSSDASWNSSEIRDRRSPGPIIGFCWQRTHSGSAPESACFGSGPELGNSLLAERRGPLDVLGTRPFVGLRWGPLTVGLRWGPLFFSFAGSICHLGLLGDLTEGPDRSTRHVGLPSIFCCRLGFGVNCRLLFLAWVRTTSLGETAGGFTLKPDALPLSLQGLKTGGRGPSAVFDEPTLGPPIGSYLNLVIPNCVGPIGGPPPNSSLTVGGLVAEPEEIPLGPLSIYASGGRGPAFREGSLELTLSGISAPVGRLPEPCGGNMVTHDPNAVPMPGKVEASPSISMGSTRSSARFDSARKVSMLERAKLRKVFLLEGETSGATSLPRQWNSKKVLKKGAQCGVKLSGVEAEELHKFLLRG
uniref:Uncharacterized protein n=1 Tax=Ananas comosus var. bracteatus TaxID=296719 RepID=A0A6V7NYA3_ANACO|nr:unnamed protein product [Ananas comosus var. bracteatus]